MRITAALVNLGFGILLAGCGSDKEPILESDSPAVVALKEAGADVKREPNMSAPDMVGRNIDLSDTSQDAEVMAHLPDVSGLIALKLSGAEVTDATLAALPELKTVTRLDVSGSKITDAGLQHLALLPGLATLNLSDTQVTGAGLANLPPRLHSLVLENLAIRDADLEHLKHLKGLSMLVLTGTQVTPGGVREFKAERPFMLTVGIKLK
jgi:hypothetical protein